MTDDTATPKPPPSLPFARPPFMIRAQSVKRCSRLAAVQALYSLEIGSQAGLSIEGAIEGTIAQYANHSLALPSSGHSDVPQDLTQKEPRVASPILPKRALVTHIVMESRTHIVEIDAVLIGYLREGWDLHKLGPMLRSVLRAAIAELLYSPDVPPKVIIHEYVSITRYFYDTAEAGFVNGVLEQCAKSLRVST